MHQTHRVEVSTASCDVEVVAALLFARGALGTWLDADRVVAWFDAATDLGDLAAHARWSVEADRDWQEDWKATIGPVHAGRSTIVPSWLADTHPGGGTIVIDPGRAFGTGHHATTTLCLEEIDAVEDEAGLDGACVADIGCGSGVLAIACALRGAHVLAVDVDKVAVEVTQANAAVNGVTIETVHGGVERTEGTFDLVVANLVTDTIAGLAADLADRTRGQLIVSGVSQDRRAVALDALDACELTRVTERERGGWIVARYRRGEVHAHA